MADNTLLNPGIGGDLIATDDIAGVKWQWVKNAFGADGAVVPVAADAGLPTTPQVGALQVGTLTNVNDTVVIACAGSTNVAIQLSPTTLVSATVTIQGSMDGGVTYGTIAVYVGSNGASSSSSLNTNANVQYAPSAGMTHVKLTLTGTSGGSATVNSRPLYGAGIVTAGLFGSIASITTSIVPGTSFTALGKAEDGVHTSGDVGVMALMVRNDGTTVLTSNDGDYSALAVDGFGAAYTRPRFSANQGNNFTKHRAISGASTNATSVKGSLGNIFSLFLANSHATLDRYFKLYDKATAPTVNTDTPTHTILLAPRSNVIVPILGFISFGTGIAYSITDLMADTGQAAIGANEVTVAMGFV
jgi:hypothetical protein